MPENGNTFFFSERSNIPTNRDYEDIIFLRIFAEVINNGHIKAWSSAVAAVLLAAWYLLSVVGLDVHRDLEHGRTYVVCGLTGGDCEAIHPEHHCHDHDCAAEGECLSGEDCCSDDFEAVLSVGGAPDVPSVPAAALSGVALPSLVPAVQLPVRARCLLSEHAPPPGGGDLLTRICVLRA